MKTRDEKLASGINKYDIERIERAEALFKAALAAVRVSMPDAPDHLVHAIAIEDLRRATGVR